MNGGIVVAPGSKLWAVLERSASEHKAVFMVGLPGVGKTLMLQQLALLAHAAGRTIHLLQWDVARQAFETPEILARYPEVEGSTHAAIRRAAGLWVRVAIAQWFTEHAGDNALLIGEAPFVGGRFVEIAEPCGDAAEQFLRSAAAEFLLPTPTLEVRRAIERTRMQEMARPRHAREAANAPPNLLELLMGDLREAGIALGVAEAAVGKGYDPVVYSAVYARLLTHRHLRVLTIDEQLPVAGSAYDLVVGQQELLPDRTSVARVMRAVEALPPDSLEQAMAAWFERAAGV